MAETTYPINDHITLTSDVDHIDLRNPMIGDTQDLQTNVKINTLLNGKSDIFRTPQTIVYERLVYEFEVMNNYAAFVTFYETYAGEEITLTNMWKQDWVGTIIDVVEIKQRDYNPADKNCKATWGFTFEGIKQ